MGADADVKPERLKTLDKLVAITVVVLSVFMAVTKVKDDNLVQAMQKSKTESVDAWAEYQASRLKLHMAEHTRIMIGVLPPGGDAAATATALAAQDKDIAHYTRRSKETMEKARALEKSYEEMSVKDDQFDTSDIFLSMAIALAAVATLTELWMMLYISWAAGGLGVALGVSAFMNLGFRMQWLADLLA